MRSWSSRKWVPLNGCGWLCKLCFHITLGDRGQKMIESGVNCYPSIKSILKNFLWITGNCRGFWLFGLLRASLTFVTLQTCWGCRESCIGVFVYHLWDGWCKTVTVIEVLCACVYIYIYIIYGLKGMVNFLCSNICIQWKWHILYVFYFLAASGLWISCISALWEGKLWVMSGLCSPGLLFCN